ncbi:MAG: P27 family phage terminase small subunit [Lysinibacillus sp.]
MARVPTKKKLKDDVVAKMKHLGVYSDNYDHTIDTYVGMLRQYLTFEKQFEESGYQITDQYTNKAGATNDRKTPIYTAMESLRKDLKAYSDVLCLNPKAYERVKKPDVPVRKEDTKPQPKKNESKLVSILGGLNASSAE